jgi:hypothetical protein
VSEEQEYVAGLAGSAECPTTNRCLKNREAAPARSGGREAPAAPPPGKKKSQARVMNENAAGNARPGQRNTDDVKQAVEEKGKEEEGAEEEEGSGGSGVSVKRRGGRVHQRITFFGAHFLEHASRERPRRSVFSSTTHLVAKKRNCLGDGTLEQMTVVRHSLRYDVVAKKMEGDAVKKGKCNAGVQARLAMQQEAMEEVQFDEYE